MEETGTHVPHVGTGDELPTGVGESVKAAERSESNTRGEPTAGGMTPVRRVSMTVGLHRRLLWGRKMLNKWWRGGQLFKHRETDKEDCQA